MKEPEKLALGETIDAGKERYGMNWPGKADCFRVIQSPSLEKLHSCPEESVNYDTTENLIIEGDNLEAIELSKKFGNEKSSSFINGILDKVAQEIKKVPRI